MTSLTFIHILNNPLSRFWVCQIVFEKSVSLGELTFNVISLGMRFAKAPWMVQF
jgi:hypothetical protein